MDPLGKEPEGFPKAQSLEDSSAGLFLRPSSGDLRSRIALKHRSSGFGRFVV